MPWPFWSKPAPTASTGSTSLVKDDGSFTPAAAADLGPGAAPPPTPRRSSSSSSKSISWNESLNATDWAHYAEPRNWVPTLLVTATALGALQFYRSYLRRIPGTAHIAPGLFRRRTLLGRVTSVGDGDNFHMFHTPGGRLAGWGWLRRVPSVRTELKGRTIPVRIAGVDAPEGAHFGRPAQPFSAEALAWLSSYLLGRRVRCQIWRRDQYERVVATVHVRRGPGPLSLIRRDVGLEMLRRGLATTYEAKTGAEFGGKVVEARYRAAEETARRKGLGMWATEKPRWFGLGSAKGVVETPREYKTRMSDADKSKENGKQPGKAS